MKLTTVAAALAATLALAHTAHAREHHVRQAINHRHSVYHYAGQYSEQYSTRYSTQSRRQSSAWGWQGDDQRRSNRRGDWSAWNTSGPQPAPPYRRGTRQAFAGSARAARYRQSASAGAYRAAYRGRFAAQAGDERAPGYRGGYGARPGAWCGWQMRQLVGRDPGPEFNLARKWTQWGHAGPAGIGAVVVWPHHVGLIVGRENGQWIVKSGNDGNRLRTRPLSVANAIGFRWN